MATSMPLMIEIPVHTEEGWLCGSPDELPVKARLEAPKRPKSPESLQKKEEYGVLLHKAQVEAVAARAARESQRAIEAKARRLRMEQTARQRLEDRQNAAAKRECRLAQEKAEQSSARTTRRKLLEAAAREARAARAEERKSRLAAEMTRSADASRKHERLIQATVDKNALAVKHALAVAASVRELEREAAAAASSKLADRLEAATARRLDSPPSPTKSSAERARAVASTLSARTVELEKKRRDLEKSLELAAQKRDAAVASISVRAAEYNAGVTVKIEAKAGEVADPKARRNLFEKLNDAEVRRGMHRRQPRGAVPEVIVISFQPESLPPAPAKLVERLSRKRAGTPLEERQSHAAKRLAALRAAEGKKLARAKAHRKATAVKRESAATALKSKLGAKEERVKEVLAAARRARCGFAQKANARVGTAAVRRSAAAALVKRAAMRAALARAAASGKRAARLFVVAHTASPRAAEVAARRSAQGLRAAVRAEALSSKCVRATAARDKLLLERASRAHLSALKNGTAAKLTAGGGVLLKHEPPSEEGWQLVESPAQE